MSTNLSFKRRYHRKRNNSYTYSGSAWDSCSVYSSPLEIDFSKLEVVSEDCPQPNTTAFGCTHHTALFGTMSGEVFFHQIYHKLSQNGIDTPSVAGSTLKKLTLPTSRICGFQFSTSFQKVAVFTEDSTLYILRIYEEVEKNDNGTFDVLFRDAEVTETIPLKSYKISQKTHISFSLFSLAGEADRAPPSCWLEDAVVLVGCDQGTVIGVTVGESVPKVVLIMEWEDGDPIIQLHHSFIQSKSDQCDLRCKRKIGVLAVSSDKQNILINDVTPLSIRACPPACQLRVDLSAPVAPLLAYARVGKKSRDAGDFGACFATSTYEQLVHLPVVDKARGEEKYLPFLIPIKHESIEVDDALDDPARIVKLYSSRHNSRVFEADAQNGIVIKTFHFDENEDTIFLLSPVPKVVYREVIESYESDTPISCKSDIAVSQCLGTVLEESTQLSSTIDEESVVLWSEAHDCIALLCLSGKSTCCCLWNYFPSSDQGLFLSSSPFRFNSFRITLCSNNQLMYVRTAPPLPDEAFLPRTGATMDPDEVVMSTKDVVSIESVPSVTSSEDLNFFENTLSRSDSLILEDTQCAGVSNLIESTPKSKINKIKKVSTKRIVKEIISKRVGEKVLFDESTVSTQLKKQLGCDGMKITHTKRKARTARKEDDSSETIRQALVDTRLGFDIVEPNNEELKPVLTANWLIEEEEKSTEKNTLDGLERSNSMASVTHETSPTDTMEVSGIDTGAETVTHSPIEVAVNLFSNKDRGHQKYDNDSVELCKKDSEVVLTDEISELDNSFQKNQGESSQFENVKTPQNERESPPRPVTLAMQLNAIVDRVYGSYKAYNLDKSAQPRLLHDIVHDIIPMLEDVIRLATVGVHTQNIRESWTPLLSFYRWTGDAAKEQERRARFSQWYAADRIVDNLELGSCQSSVNGDSPRDLSGRFLEVYDALVYLGIKHSYVGIASRKGENQKQDTTARHSVTILPHATKETQLDYLDVNSIFHDEVDINSLFRDCDHYSGLNSSMKDQRQRCQLCLSEGDWAIGAGQPFDSLSQATRLNTLLTTAVQWIFSISLHKPSTNSYITSMRANVNSSTGVSVADWAGKCEGAAGGIFLSLMRRIENMPAVSETDKSLSKVGYLIDGSRVLRAMRLYICLKGIPLYSSNEDTLDTLISIFSEILMSVSEPRSRLVVNSLCETANINLNKIDELYTSFIDAESQVQENFLRFLSSEATLVKGCLQVNAADQGVLANRSIYLSSLSIDSSVDPVQHYNNTSTSQLTVLQWAGELNRVSTCCADICLPIYVALGGAMLDFKKYVASDWRTCRAHHFPRLSPEFNVKDWIQSLNQQQKLRHEHDYRSNPDSVLLPYYQNPLKTPVALALLKRDFTVLNLFIPEENNNFGDMESEDAVSYSKASTDIDLIHYLPYVAVAFPSKILALTLAAFPKISAAHLIFALSYPVHLAAGAVLNHWRNVIPSSQLGITDDGVMLEPLSEMDLADLLVQTALTVSLRKSGAIFQDPAQTLSENSQHHTTWNTTEVYPLYWFDNSAARWSPLVVASLALKRREALLFELSDIRARESGERGTTARQLPFLYQTVCTSIPINFSTVSHSSVTAEQQMICKKITCIEENIQEFLKQCSKPNLVDKRWISESGMRELPKQAIKMDVESLVKDIYPELISLFIKYQCVRAVVELDIVSFFIDSCIKRHAISDLLPLFQYGAYAAGVSGSLESSSSDCFPANRRCCDAAAQVVSDSMWISLFKSSHREKCLEEFFCLALTVYSQQPKKVRYLLRRAFPLLDQHDKLDDELLNISIKLSAVV